MRRRVKLAKASPVHGPDSADVSRPVLEGEIWKRRSLSRFEPSTGIGLQRGTGDSLGLVPRLKERRLRTRSGTSCLCVSSSL